MRLEILSTRSPSTETPQVPAGLLRGDFLIGAGFQVLAHPQTTGISSGSSRGKHMIRADDLSWAWSISGYIIQNFIPGLTLSP